MFVSFFALRPLLVVVDIRSGPDAAAAAAALCFRLRRTPSFVDGLRVLRLVVRRRWKNSQAVMRRALLQCWQAQLLAMQWLRCR